MMTNKDAQFLTQISDINLKHKMPLEAFGSIMSWAKNFFPSDIKNRGRETVLNDIKKRLKIKKMIWWSHLEKQIRKK